MTIEKTVLSEIRKGVIFKSSIFIINNHIHNYYDKISLGDYDVKKSLLLDCII